MLLFFGFLVCLLLFFVVFQVLSSFPRGFVVVAAVAAAVVVFVTSHLLFTVS